MKVLMFGWEFPPHISGGLGTACYGLTKGLVQQDVEILFVMPRASGDEDGSIGRIINASDVNMPDSISSTDSFWSNISFLPVDSGLIPYLGWEEYAHIAQISQGSERTNFTHLGGKFTFSGKYGANLMEEVMRYAYIASKIAAENEFDVIHAHDWLTYLAGIVAKRISGKPLVVHVHATEFDRSGENVNRTVYDLERMGMEHADSVITVSNLTRDIVINRYGINKNKVVTVHNAVDFSGKETVASQKVLKEKVITFLGRITFQKGPEYFIEAAYKVSKVCPNVRFVMAGSGDMMNKMVRRVAKLRMGTKFTFTGFLTGDDVHKMYAQSDVYVMPSVSEPFGISPLEAMRMGVPTIISKQSGVSEVLKHAIKVNFWDINALADAMYGLVTYPTLATALQGEGTAEVNALNWDDSANRVKAVYESVMA
ncbi:glycosyltransferase family 4 protein [Dysgonomonas macrotermitis]|uniref:Glycosyltransferase involved in cell wall bisynthesis n=1 Tax=Dysgonomonas macrotermitis TaxID=1346286 RepID=A0A1M5B1B2_9BACT|nr:glycosyltransferase family 4 protein [Dysgonomonas macrotermitis]SHF36351.1 Glycosyltransferase involved in cell wall bisynthesis [Dysgonomonas macrotermitis]